MSKKKKIIWLSVILVSLLLGVLFYFLFIDESNDLIEEDNLVEDTNDVDEINDITDEEAQDNDDNETVSDEKGEEIEEIDKPDNEPNLDEEVSNDSQGNDFNKVVAQGQEPLYEGSEDAENEVLFVFDYLCPWCSIWLVENYNELEELIEDGVIKFRTQSMALLSNESLFLSNVDQNVKANYSDKYMDFLMNLSSDKLYEVEDWGEESYLSNLANRLDMDIALLLEEPELDSVSLTRQYTKGLSLEVVPSIYVNGQIVEDISSMDEFLNYLQ